MNSIIIFLSVTLAANVSTTVVSDPASVSLNDAGQVILDDPLDAVTIITDKKNNTITVVYQ